MRRALAGNEAEGVEREYSKHAIECCVRARQRREARKIMLDARQLFPREPPPKQHLSTQAGVEIAHGADPNFDQNAGYAEQAGQAMRRQDIRPSRVDVALADPQHGTINQ